MGITIHYKGRLNDNNLIEPFILEFEDIAKDMNWEYQILDEDLSEPNTAYIENGKINGNLPLKGISINIHPDSETLSFYFDKDGNLRDLLSTALLSGEDLENSYSFVKTQFVPFQIHITIVKLLRYIKSKYINNITVVDESEYWTSNDELQLKNKFEFIDNRITEMVNDLESTSNDTLEVLLDKIEKLFKRKFK